MRILITGATGFIGSQLVRHLVPRHDIAVLLRPEAKKECLADISPPPHVLVWSGKAEDMQPLLSDFRPECVIHLASYFTNAKTPDDIDRLMESNLRFPTLVLEAMANAGCTAFINTGSIMQHHENAAYAPASLYAASKQAFADILTYYVRSGAIKRALTLELTDTYGQGDPRPKLIALLQKAAQSGEALGMSLGEQYMDLVHVRDVARAFEHALAQLPTIPEGQQKVFAVRSEAPITVRQLVELFNKTSPNPVTVEWGRRSYRQYEFFTPWQQGEVLPGWSPKTGLEQGLREMLEAT